MYKVYCQKEGCEMAVIFESYLTALNYAEVKWLQGWNTQLTQNGNIIAEYEI